MMLRSLNQQPKFYLADNYVGRFLDLWFLLLLFTSNYIIHIECLANGLEPRKKKFTSSPGTSTFSHAFHNYSNYNQCLCAVQIKHGDNKRAWMRHAGGRRNVPKGRRRGWFGVQTCESNTATPWILSQWCTEALYNRSRQNCIKLHGQVFRSNRLSLTCLLNSKMIYLASASPIFDLKIYFYKHGWWSTNNKQTLNRWSESSYTA